jgi:murein DD-endopeptidase MepM/ murein hydrolase activator NlpD
MGALEAGVEEQRAAQSLLLDQIEAAAQLSIGPLEEALSGAGVDIDAVIRALRAEDGQGGPFVPAPEIVAALAPAEGAAVASVMSDLERVSLLRAAVRRMPFAVPVSAPRITSGFGRRRDPFNFRAAFHEGIDFAGASGTPIYATAHGVVALAGAQRGYGRVVKIRHDFGFETVYGHLSRVRVSVGDRVGPGDRIGDMGSTGRSTGTHLHYEIRVNGKPVDPMTFIEAARDVL